MQHDKVSYVVLVSPKKSVDNVFNAIFQFLKPHFQLA